MKAKTCMSCRHWTVDPVISAYGRCANIKNRLLHGGIKHRCPQFTAKSAGSKTQPGKN